MTPEDARNADERGRHTAANNREKSESPKSTYPRLEDDETVKTPIDEELPF